MHSVSRNRHEKGRDISPLVAVDGSEAMESVLVAEYLKNPEGQEPGKILKQVEELNGRGQLAEGNFRWTETRIGRAFRLFKWRSPSSPQVIPTLVSYWSVKI